MRARLSESVHIPGSLDLEKPASHFSDYGLQNRVGVNDFDDVSFGLPQSFPDAGEMNIKVFLVPHYRMTV